MHVPSIRFYSLIWRAFNLDRNQPVLLALLPGTPFPPGRHPYPTATCAPPKTLTASASGSVVTRLAHRLFRGPASAAAVCELRNRGPLRGRSSPPTSDPAGGWDDCMRTRVARNPAPTTGDRSSIHSRDVAAASWNRRCCSGSASWPLAKRGAREQWMPRALLCRKNRRWAISGLLTSCYTWRAFGDAGSSGQRISVFRVEGWAWIWLAETAAGLGSGEKKWRFPHLLGEGFERRNVDGAALTHMPEGKIDVSLETLT